MTHEELLNRISDPLMHSSIAEHHQKALYEVVKLHAPHHYGMDWMPKDLCSMCMDEGRNYEPSYYMKYPCPTIQAIEKAVNG